jgi:hypothetical protein
MAAAPRGVLILDSQPRYERLNYRPTAGIARFESIDEDTDEVPNEIGIQFDQNSSGSRSRL